MSGSMEENIDKLGYIKEHICSYNDFPKPGIVFRDIFSALSDAKCCQYIREMIVSYLKERHADEQIDLIVGLEARGFLFSLMIATEMKCGCIPVRKMGKLPGKCFSIDYNLEYGQSRFEIQKNAIRPGQKVVVIDDLLATGGTLKASIDLIRKAGGIVVDCVVIMELVELNGRKCIDANVHSFIKY